MLQLVLLGVIYGQLMHLGGIGELGEQVMGLLIGGEGRAWSWCLQGTSGRGKGRF